MLLTALELDVFTTVGEGATAAEVALRLATDLRATEIPLNAISTPAVDFKIAVQG